MTDAPYLSVVATARNDDHGGNLLRRMQTFVDGLLTQCARHRVRCELVMVEWNPVEGRAGLDRALDWSRRNEFTEVRIISVPGEMHRRLEHWAALPLYQMIAKNVGIRRARGEFVLATNIDLLFSDELFEFLAGRRLERGKMYRADRWDVMSDVPAEKSMEEQLAWCNTHLLRVNRREGTFALNPDGSERIDAADVVSPERGLRLGRNWFHKEMSGEEAFRWVENDAEVLIEGPGRFLMLEVERGPGVKEAAFELEVRDAEGATLGGSVVEGRAKLSVALAGEKRVFLHCRGGGREIPGETRVLNFRVFRCELAEQGLAGPVPENLATRLGRAARVLTSAVHSRSEIRIPLSREALRRLDLRQDAEGVAFRMGPLFGKQDASVVAERHRVAPVRLHINACGDFTLLAREHWLDLRGYPEFDAFSMNLDALFCWMAHHGGAREEVLPFRVFHIEHATGSGWTPEGERKLYERIAATGLPWIEIGEVMAWAETMRRFDTPMIFNRDKWGLGGEELAEIHLSERNG